MHSHRCAILSLIATGRITPAEAERLLAVSNENSDLLLTLTACICVALLSQTHPAGVLADLASFMRQVPVAVIALVHQAQLIFAQILGGIL